MKSLSQHINESIYDRFSNIENEKHLNDLRTENIRLTKVFEQRIKNMQKLNKSIQLKLFRTAVDQLDLFICYIKGKKIFKVAEILGDKPIILFIDDHENYQSWSTTKKEVFRIIEDEFDLKPHKNKYNAPEFIGTK